MEKNKPEFKVYLKMFGLLMIMKKLEFGHRFAEVNDNIDKLFTEYDANAIDHYVKKFSFIDQRLESRPEVKY